MQYGEDLSVPRLDPVSQKLISFISEGLLGTKQTVALFTPVRSIVAPGDK
jgi:hypothetical protein